MTALAPTIVYAPLADLDWNDLPAVTAASALVLDQLSANRPLLGELTALRAAGIFAAAA